MGGTSSDGKVAQVTLLIQQECTSVQLEALSLLRQTGGNAAAGLPAQEIMTGTGVTQALEALQEGAGAQAAASMAPGAPLPAAWLGGQFLVLNNREAVRQATGLRDRLLRPSLSRRLSAWQALSARVGSLGGADSPALAAELQQEYDYLMAWQSGMAFQIGLFMASFVVVGGVANHLGYAYDQELGLYVAAAYWGAVGAIGSCIYQLIRETSRRGLRLEDNYGYFLRPLLGGILGLLVVMLMPVLLSTERMADLTAQHINLALVLAALFGLSEASFFKRIKAVTAALLGSEDKPAERLTAPSN